MKRIRRAKRSYLVFSVLLSVLGVCIMIRPDISILTLCNLIGVICVSFGIIKFFGYFSKDPYGLAFQFDFALGVLALVTGLLLLTHPGRILSLVQFLIGLFILIDGIFKLQTAIDAKRFGLTRWWTILLLALVSGAGGLLLILDPFDSARALMILLGLSLTLDGIQNLGIVLYTVRCLRNSSASDNVIM